MKTLLALLLIAFPASGAFTRVSHGLSAGGSSVTLNSTGADFIVASVSSDTAVAFADSQGGFTNTATQVVVTTTGSRLTMYYYVNPAHVGASHTFNVSGPSFYNIEVAAYGGSKLTSPLDLAAVTNLVSGATSQPGSYTPSCTNELLISGLAAFGGAPAPTITGTGWAITDAQHTGYAGGMADWIQTTATNTSGPTWTCNAGGGTCYASAVMAFKAADSVCGGTAAIKHKVSQ